MVVIERGKEGNDSRTLHSILPFMLLIQSGSEESLCWINHSQANRGGDICCLIDKGQLPSALVDAEGDDVIAVLIGSQQECAAGVNGEVSRSPAMGCLVRNDRQPPRILVDGKNCQAIVPAIGAVQKVS